MTRIEQFTAVLPTAADTAKKRDAYLKGEESVVVQIQYLTDFLRKNPTARSYSCSVDPLVEDRFVAALKSRGYAPVVKDGALVLDL